MKISSKPSSKSAERAWSRPGNRSLRHVSVAELLSALGCEERDLQAIFADPSQHYLSFSKTRNGKTREFNPPRRRLRHFQDRLLASVFSSYEAHPAAFSVRGRGTLRAANRHLRNRWLLHLDLKDFFPNVRVWKLERALLKFMEMRADATERIAALVTLNDGLPQGAPTSPLFANIVLEELDLRLEGFARKYGFCYTRYLDDIHLSGDDRISKFGERQVRAIIGDSGWDLHPEKGGVFGPSHRQEILGLSVNQALGLPNRYVREVRRRMRRRSDPGEGDDLIPIQSLEGQIAWVSVISPGRGRALRRLLRDSLHPSPKLRTE